MNHLLRELAPISTAGWVEIEKEAKRTLKTTKAEPCRTLLTGSQKSRT